MAEKKTKKLKQNIFYSKDVGKTKIKLFLLQRRKVNYAQTELTFNTVTAGKTTTTLIHFKDVRLRSFEAF